MLTEAEVQGLVERVYQAVLSCGHTIVADAVTVRFDARQPGHNALNQLRRRIDDAVRAPKEPGLSETAQIPPRPELTQ